MNRFVERIAFANLPLLYAKYMMRIPDPHRTVAILIHTLRVEEGGIGRSVSAWQEQVEPDIPVPDLDEIDAQIRHDVELPLAVLKERRMLYEKDGATWFRATDFGDEKDRVVVRDNGKKTYFASDIAYHYGKRERGYDHLIDILGSDHHGYVARVQAGLEAMGYAGDSLEVELVQFVTLYRGGEKMQKKLFQTS